MKISFLILTFFEVFFFIKCGIQMNYRLQENKLFTKTLFGTPSQEVLTEIDQISPYTVLIKKDFEQNNSSTISNYGFRIVSIYKSLYEAELVRDIFSFSDFSSKIEDFRFYHLKENSLNSFISLTFGFYDIRFSLVHCLASQGLIEGTWFYVVPAENKEEGKIIFGNITETSLERLNKGKCQVDKRYLAWVCHLKCAYSIIYNYSSKKNDVVAYSYQKEVSFQLNENKIIFPYEFFMMFTKNVIKKLVGEENCEYLGNGKEIFFQCYITFIKDIKSLPDLYFTFEEFEFKISMSDLFDCSNHEQCISLFKCKRNREKFIFGYEILKHFITKFDYKNEMVTFYSSSRVLSLFSDDGTGKKKRSSFVSLIISIEIGVDIFGLVLLFYTKYLR